MSDTIRERIELPGGWRLEPYLHPLGGTPTGDHWLIKPNGLKVIYMRSYDARALAASLNPLPKTGADQSDALDCIAAKDAEIATLNARIADYEEAFVDKRRLTRELDVALHGEDGAAKQASLCDLIEPAKAMRAQIATLTAATEERAGQICGACGQPWTGDKCGQADNGWPHQVCYPVAASSVTTGDTHTAPPRPFQTYPEDRAKLLKLCDDAKAGKDFAAEELFDLVRAILTDEQYGVDHGVYATAGDTTEGR